MCVSFFFFKQKTAYEMRISDWSSDVCSSDLRNEGRAPIAQEQEHDDDREERALDHRVDRARILLLCIFGVVVEELELDLGVACLEILQLLDRAVIDGDVRRPLGALDIETHHQIGRASCRERVCQYV